MIHFVRGVISRLKRLESRGAFTIEPRTGEHAGGVATASDRVTRRQGKDRRLHDGVVRLGRRRSDRRWYAVEQRRVLLAGGDDGWRLLATYLFEEAGFTVYPADQRQVVTLAARLLPDLVVMQLATPETLDLPAGLGEASTSNIPVVVLTSKLESVHVHHGGALVLLPVGTDIIEVVAEAESLTVAAPRVQRTLKRRLVALKELAQHYSTDAEGHDRLRHLIDRLQVAILAVDAEGRCIAASEGAMALTGYSRPQLLSTSLLRNGFAGEQASDELWRAVLGNRPYAGTTRIINRAGEEMTVHAAAVTEILPGLHVAAFAAM